MGSRALLVSGVRSSFFNAIGYPKPELEAGSAMMAINGKIQR
jgi:hypothetical protein